MHGFPHQFLIIQENPTKRIVLGEPVDSHPMVYFIKWEMHAFSHQFSIVWEKAGRSVEWGKAGKSVPILFR